jgi:hypothetical protein
MSPRNLFIVGGIVLLAGCSSGPDLEWMKVGQPYTAAEFRRDYAACDKTSNLDDCLRDRGWVSVTAPTAPKKAQPEMRLPPGGTARPPY